MINVIVSADSRYNVNKSTIQTAVINILQKNRVTGKVEIGISIVGDRKMHELNKKYRGIDSSTNILSFALEDPHPAHLQNISKGFVAAPDAWLRLGDILISHPQAVEDAALEGTSVEDEINFLVEHGVNHLLGIHH